MDGYRDRTLDLAQCASRNRLCFDLFNSFTKRDETLRGYMILATAMAWACFSQISLMFSTPLIDSTCSAKHDDSALESVSKSLNQGLKV